jgi:hypothetical protein
MSNDIIDLGGYPEFYADEVAEIQSLSGGNRRVIYIAWKKLDGVYRRVISGVAIRPAVGIATAAPMFREAAKETAHIVSMLQ